MIKIIVKDKVFPRQHGVRVSPYATKEEILASRKINNVGFGIETPLTAINDTYVDKKCPFTGNVHVRGRIFNGEVIKMKAERTIVVSMKYLFYDKKYKRYARRNTKINVHLSDCFKGLVQVGDVVTCGETRPMSKTKASVVIAIAKKVEDKSTKVFSL